jgi:large subunit ribosomal protein L10
MVAPKPSGISNTRAGKALIIERTKKLVDQSALIIVAPVKGVTKEQMDLLRKDLPKGTKASVVKNALLRVAVQDTQFAPLGENLGEENMFFFIPEGSAKGTFEAYQKWQKEVKRAEPEFDAKVGVMEGVRYEGKDIESVANLPTKAELMKKLALTIKAVPLKLARTIKAVPNKVGRIFALINQKKEEEAKKNSEMAEDVKDSE